MTHLQLPPYDRMVFNRHRVNPRARYGCRIVIPLRNEERLGDPPSWIVTEQKARQCIPMPPSHQYLNKRHCKVHVRGTVMREVLYATSHQGASHDGKYDFDLEPVESDLYQYEHTFKIKFTLRSSLHNRTSVPMPGCPVRLQILHKKSHFAFSKTLKNL